MTQYAGLCIGGPLDGQALAAQTTHHRVEERPAFGGPLSPREADHAARITVKTVSYAWHALPGMGIWVPEGVTLEQAVSDMATLYANTVNR